MVIAHNMASLNTMGTIKKITLAKSNSTKKLSSGYRINAAADDAAGLSISEKMRAQIRGLNRAAVNAQDGISYIQIAEGALNESHSILQRCKELSVQGANDTNTEEDREAIQAELEQLSKELDRISKTTQFNSMDIFLNGSASSVQAPGSGSGSANQINVNISWSFVDSGGNVVALDASQAVGQDTNYKDSDFAKFIEDAAADAVANLYNNYSGSLFSNASSTINVGLNLANIDGVGDTLASASLSMASGTNAGGAYTTMTYTLNVDKADYDASKFSTMTDAQKADLAATVAHEMTHLVMYDTLTDGMLKDTVKSYPKWFVEGMAQTSSGDNGWVSNHLSPASTDAQIKNYMSQIKTMPYGAGYLGTMYLGYAASGSSSTTNLKGDIISGLNNIFNSLTAGKTLDQAIADNTSYSGLADFENAFKNADTKSLTFTKALINQRGSGAGSLFGASLSTTEAAAFAPATLTDDIGNYVIKSDNTKYMNAFGAGYTFPEKERGIAGADDILNLQVGALGGQGIQLERFDVSTSALFGGSSLDVSDFELAGATMDTVEKAIERVSTIRSYYGAIQNRLEHTIANLENTSENTQAAESAVRDTDMAEEMVVYSKNNILSQAAMAMLAQANQSTQGVLSLIQ